jgi:sialidase-1
MNRLSTSILRGLLCLGLVTLAWVPEAPAASGQDGVLFRTEVFAKGVDGYNTYRIPTLVVTGKGTLLLFVEGRVNSRRDMGDIDMLLKRSEDGGRTWSKNMVLLNEGAGRVGNSCAIVERDGKTVHLLFTRHVGECLFHTKSTDEGKTWSRLVAISDRPDQKEYSKTNFLKDFGGSPVMIGVGPVHGIHTKEGRLIAPCNVARTMDGKRVGNCATIHSDDGGKTWKPGGLVPNTLAGGECTMAVRSDGSYLMNMRGGSGYRVISTSADRGVTWSRPVLDKNLPESGCQASLIRLNEKEILFSNPAIHRVGGFSALSRRYLTLRLSRDDGRTWPHSRVLNVGLAGYSDMAVTKDGRIFCAFENGVLDYCDYISVAEVSREWLLSPEPPRRKPIPASASYRQPFYRVSALSDDLAPRSSCDQGIPRFTWWNHVGTREWVQYTFDAPRKVSAVEVYWYAKGAIQPPASWRILFRSGKSWQEVAGASAYGTRIDTYNRVTFNEVETRELRLEAQLQPKQSGGILEWRVETTE